MAWTTPITWVAGQVVTAATMNAQVSGNFNWLAGPDRCQVTNTGAQTIATSYTLLTWNTNTVISNAAMHSTSVNPSRLIAATAGTYRLDLSLGVSAAGVLSGLDVRKNAAGSSTGGTRVAFFNANSLAIAAGGLFAATADMIVLSANDYVELFAQATTGTPTVISSTYGTAVNFRWVNF